VIKSIKKNDVDKIVKIQANFRGFMQRRVNRHIHEIYDVEANISHRSNGQARPSGKMFEKRGNMRAIARELKEMPVFHNEASLRAEMAQGEFTFDLQKSAFEEGTI
jgi:hypothetical protein